jgi:hypothetical protein
MFFTFVFLQVQGDTNMCGICALNNLLKDETPPLELTPEEVDTVADDSWLQLISEHGGQVDIPQLRSRSGDYNIDVLKKVRMRVSQYSSIRHDLSAIVCHREIPAIQSKYYGVSYTFRTM